MLTVKGITCFTPAQSTALSILNDLVSASRRQSYSLQVDLMVVIKECNSEIIDILRASPDIDGVKNRIKHREYSDIFVLYASDELIGNLKSHLDGKMEKLEIKGISSMWKILFEK